MKNTERKARIREMLKAEGLIAPDKMAPNGDWNRFKRELNSSADGIPPQLEILPPRKKNVTRWFISVAALAIVGVVFFLWQIPVSYTHLLSSIAVGWFSLSETPPFY